LKQRRLRFRAGAVELVGKEHMAEDRPGTELEVLPPGLEPQSSHDITRQKVARHLHALEAAAEKIGETLRERRFAYAWRALEQHVPTSEERDQRGVHGFALPQHHLLEGIA